MLFPKSNFFLCFSMFTLFPPYFHLISRLFPSYFQNLTFSCVFPWSSPYSFEVISDYVSFSFFHVLVTRFSIKQSKPGWNFGVETSLDSDVLLRGYHGGFTLENNLEIRMVIGILHIVSHPRNGEERLRVWQCFLQTNRHKYVCIYIYIPPDWNLECRFGKNAYPGKMPKSSRNDFKVILKVISKRF